MHGEVNNGSPLTPTDRKSANDPKADIHIKSEKGDYWEDLKPTSPTNVSLANFKLWSTFVWRHTVFNLFF